eukprot:Gb_14130 [translate_table: standard]
MMNNNGTHSGWQSAIPILMGGVAAMLGVIAFASLILVCSWCSLNRHIEGNNEAHAGVSEEFREKEKLGCNDMGNCAMVVMAGDEKPTFLAKPMTAVGELHVNMNVV